MSTTASEAWMASLPPLGGSLTTVYGPVRAVNTLTNRPSSTASRGTIAAFTAASGYEAVAIPHGPRARPRRQKGARSRDFGRPRATRRKTLWRGLLLESGRACRTAGSEGRGFDPLGGALTVRRPFRVTAFQSTKRLTVGLSSRLDTVAARWIWCCPHHCLAELHGGGR